MSGGKNWLRAIGLVLLLFLFWRIDIRRLWVLLIRVSLLPCGIAIFLNIPQITLKAFRWRWILRAQSTRYAFWPAILSYFGSIFIGLLTPARLGEFVKALHINVDCDVSVGEAFSSVLADRLFDFYLLLIVGGLALLSMASWQDSNSLLGLFVLALLLILPLVVLMHEGLFSRIQTWGNYLGRPGQWLFQPGNWIHGIRNGLRQLSMPWLLAAVGLTIVAYAIFFGQCYLVAFALGLRISLVQVSFAVALGSLVTLLPISISGLGTREAAIVAYLGRIGVPAEAALGFSLLVFVTFYIMGGLMGAVAWWIKPLPLDSLRALRSSE